MSTNWKDIGMNSGNMRNHRNVTSNKLNYETGKWDSIYEVSGIEMKGYTFDICGQNVVVGIGTEKPFSRLSLGNNDNDGEFNANKPGQLAGIGIHEEPNGGNFSGLFYNTDISGQKKNAGLIPGLQIMSSTTDFSLNDTANTGKIIIGSDNVVTIGGSARIGNESFQGGSNALPGTYSLANNENRKIVLDTRGSIRTDGYINFYNQTNNNEFKPNGLDYTNHSDIPVGSLFLSSGGGNIVSEAGLYFKKSNTGQGSDIVRIADGTGGSSGGGGSGVDSPFDYSLNNVINGAAAPAYIVQKSGDTGFVGGTNITFAGEKWSTTDASGGLGYQNTLTIREGNLSVVTISGENIKVNDPGTSSLKTAYDNRAGGILFASKQILIGKNKDDSATNDLNRSGYALIDAQVIENVPAFLSYNFATGDTKFNPTKATNSIILIEKNTSEDGNNISGNSRNIIGQTFDASHSIIIGGRFSEISTPASIISNPVGWVSNTDQRSNEIIEPSGCNIVFGLNNTLKYSPFTIIQGANNEVLNNTNALSSQLGGSLVVGSSNKIQNEYGQQKTPQNIIFGNNNISNVSQNTFIQGNNNVNFGDSNAIFGQFNELGYVADDLVTATNHLQCYTTSNSFVQGNSNTILAPSGETVNNVFIAGKNNKLDVSFNSFTTNTNTSYTLFGTYAGISGESYSDTSNVRFAFGTYEKWQHNGGLATENGNVLTIDNDGHTRIYGSLTVDGSFVKLNVIHKDVSDNNITLNDSLGHPAHGGGITILDTVSGLGNHGLTWLSTPQIYGSQNYWDTSGADISTNNLFVNNIISQDISSNDASFNDISAVSLYVFGDVSFNGHVDHGGDISTNDVSCVRLFAHDGFFNGDISAVNINAHDISANDISVNDISAVNGFFYGDISAVKIDAHDISVNDISCVDISGRNAFFNGDISCNGKLTVYGLIDPTGLILDISNSGAIPGYTPTADKLLLFYDGTSGGLKFQAGTNPIQNISATSGSSTGMSNWKISAGGTSSNVVENNTVTIAGGTNVSVAESSRTVTINSSIPQATASIIGGIKVGDRLSMSANASGVLTGGTFTGYDFNTNADEDLVLIIDGTSYTLTLTANCSAIVGAVNHISSLITSGSVPAAITQNGSLIITSNSSGINSSVDIDTANSGSNAESLFGSFTTSNTSGVLSADFNPAAPGAIGGTTPSTGAFTSLTATGTVTIGDVNTQANISMPTNTSGQGKKLIITGQAAKAATNAQGGNIEIKGGVGGTTNGGGGDVHIRGGEPKGNGTSGQIFLEDDEQNTLLKASANLVEIGATKLTITVADGDISGNDASFNDISAVNFFGNASTATEATTVTAGAHTNITGVGTLTSLVVSGDLSGNDASFNDISAVNFFSVGSSFFGDVHAKVASSFHDISGNDASFNDISANRIFSISDAHFGNIKIESDYDAAAGTQSAITTIDGSLIIGAATTYNIELREPLFVWEPYFYKRNAKLEVNKTNNTAAVNETMVINSGSNCIVNAYIEFKTSSGSITAGEQLSITLPSVPDIFSLLPENSGDWETTFTVNTIGCDTLPTIKQSEYNNTSTNSGNPNNTNTIFKGRQTTGGGAGGTGTSHIVLNKGRIITFTIRTLIESSVQKLEVYWTSTEGVNNTLNQATWDGTAS